MTERGKEIATKLAIVRASMRHEGLAAIRLRGVDWFSWATAGGNSTVILTAETGVGEVLITQERAWVLTNEIEKDRFRDEEIPADYEIWAGPWNDSGPLEAFVAEQVRGGPGPGSKIASDRPKATEHSLPRALVAAKRRLLPSEITRYRALGLEAAQAMTEVLRAAQPEWTEFELAAEGAKALWARGIHPTLVLAAGDERALKHRHPFPTCAKLGSRAMLVFCARRGGLYANLTRWVYFREPSSQERRLNRELAQIEVAAFEASQAGVTLEGVYAKIAKAYASAGYAGQELNHHQGGTTGYLSREVVATPSAFEVLEENTALAWNPSLPGGKLEDTVLLQAQGLEVLTEDPNWPSFEAAGRRRPDFWVRE